MKTNFLKYSVFILIIFSIACSDEFSPHFNFESYPFSSVNAEGGKLRPILLNTASQIEIPTPVSTTSAAYQTELATLRQLLHSENINEQAVAYWTANPIVRWNEIALELAAKYNLLPSPNADGSYTLPTPSNPNGPPPFPFAHPPYASRAFAYLSVAQYDGLITAWHYKFLYNRPAPHEVDTNIKLAYPRNALPSYPSDGAVLAIASRDVLLAMFPLEANYLSQMADEHLGSLLYAGLHVESDLEAGKIIGAEVAKIALKRAATDGMHLAQTPLAVSESIKQAAMQRFGWAWINLEIPPRPVGIVPFFGKVKMWNVPNVEDVRPEPPPAIGSAAFNKDVEELKRFAKNLTNEQRKIANWWQDGAGTYTPPGHWNRLAKEHIVTYRLNPLQSARVFAYMNMAIMDAGISCWDAKYYYYYPRPIQTIPGFKTILGTPNFPSYTSGHSTFSGAAAEILAYFFPNEAAKFQKKAVEAGDSRIYGGIHYRFDSEVGLEQGKKVATYAINRAKLDETP